MLENDLSASHQIDMSQLEELLGPDAYSLTPATLAYKVSQGDWYPARHLSYLSAKIAHALHKGGARLIISIPVRHGKSELISHWSSVWALHTWPTWEIILCSYGADLATDFGRKVRGTIQNDADPIDGLGLLNCRLDKKSTQVGRFHTDAGGGMFSVGLGGAIYGRGADLLLVDDYIKNHEEAMSETYREKIFDWFTTVAMSRLHPKGNVIIIATRWHKDDLSGRLLALPNSRWEEVKIPLRIDTPEQQAADPLKRQMGEVIWPVRYDNDMVAEWEDTMTSYFFAAIMQQEPKESVSDHFDRSWIRIVDKLPNPVFLRFLRSWDLAGTQGGGDWTVGTLMALDTRNNQVYIVARERFQKASGAVKKRVLEVAEEDTTSTIIKIEQEPGSSGKAVIDDYVSSLAGYSVEGIKHTGDKFVRAEPFFAACEHGRVSMLRGDWNDEMLDELMEFSDDDSHKNDDQVDTLSQGFNSFFKKTAKAGAWGRPKIITPNNMGKVVYNKSSGGVLTGVTWGRK